MIQRYEIVEHDLDENGKLLQPGRIIHRELTMYEAREIYDLKYPDNKYWHLQAMMPDSGFSGQHQDALDKEKKYGLSAL